jgi:poly-gamma-glutamate capsule biosynthesis protein CapA/YwtB (metallophosphatase superfamily)
MPVVLATGDIAPDREDADSLFGRTRGLLGEADLVFGQLETTFARTGLRLPQARHAVLAGPEGAGALARAGFDVISCAGNHCLDWGSEALLESLGHLRSAGIDVVGAGPNLEAARAPVVRELGDGTRVAFLAYSSILPMGYWAQERRPGCAPLRAHTLYEQIEPDQPGTPPRIHTYAHTADLAAMVADITAAKQRAHLVFVSLHWGIHFERATLADYQREVARAAVAAGADAILGHHAHILKGVELMGRRPVFYSLCNFATDLRMDAEHAARPAFKEIQRLAVGWEPDFESLYNFPPDSRMSVIARLEVAKGTIRSVGLIPLWIGRDAVPEPLGRRDERFHAVVGYLRDVSREAGLSVSFEVDSGSDLVRVNG